MVFAGDDEDGQFIAFIWPLVHDVCNGTLKQSSREAPDSADAIRPVVTLGAERVHEPSTTKDPAG